MRERVAHGHLFRNAQHEQPGRGEMRAIEHIRHAEVAEQRCGAAGARCPSTMRRSSSITTNGFRCSHAPAAADDRMAFECGRGTDDVRFLRAVTR
jgi:hypothetical protein